MSQSVGKWGYFGGLFVLLESIRARNLVKRQTCKTNKFAEHQKRLALI